MLIVLLLMAVKQNDLVAATRHFSMLKFQSVVNEMPAGTGKNALNRISIHDDTPDKFLQIFSFNGYISRSTINTAVNIKRSVADPTITYAPEWAPAGINITLVTIKFPLPISRLSGAVTTCMASNRTVHLNDVCLENLVCLPPGKETVIANHS